MKVLAACIAQARPIAAKSGMTGHFKAAQPAVTVGHMGLDGDTIVDRANHGGPDQAVYIFTQTDRLWWADHLGRDLPAGFFGENLLIDGLASADLALGDLLVIGDVTLQVTAPRIPCITFAARIGDPQGVKMFHKAARPGAYARVLHGGDVTPLDVVKHIEYDGERIGIVENFAQYLAGFPDHTFLEALLRVPAHHKALAMAAQRLGHPP
ncbi:MOSC domain-containing protein [Octadecabacter sp. SW4]|uniref:MOSC domain-containing protein n=1 Tax=Octadecabacter sp. SW4 TaxID=2602067 RepID=UPI0011C1E140|nr:MOSC domain-containing protein [Octadecabacter sp. SW4]QEE35837.1 MOSC domain-containing protein [Octadecabacter sp. SW4]